MSRPPLVACGGVAWRVLLLRHSADFLLPPGLLCQHADVTSLGGYHPRYDDDVHVVAEVREEAEEAFDGEARSAVVLASSGFARSRLANTLSEAALVLNGVELVLARVSTKAHVGVAPCSAALARSVVRVILGLPALERRQGLEPRPVEAE